ncbi:MAG: inorganic phosphate transporter [Bacillota bacterium]
MLLLTVSLIVLVFLAVMLVAGNNLSACIGPAIGSRIITKRFGIFLGAIGFSTGLLVQGSNMINSVAILLPRATSALRVEATLVAVLVFIFAYKIRAPLSLSMSLVGLLAGLSIAKASPINGIFVGEVVLTWVLVPFASFALAFFVIRFLNRGWPGNFWRRLQEYKVLIIVLSFSSAYVTGANTLGFVAAVGGFDLYTIIAAVAGIFIGSLFLSEGAIRRVSQEFFLMRYANATATLVTSTFLLELATLFNIPFSITQATSTAVFGIGVSYKTKFVTAKPFLKIAAAWIFVPLLSFAIGIIIG